MKRNFSRVLVVLMVLALALTTIVACKKKVTEDTTEHVTLEVWTLGDTVAIDSADVTKAINAVVTEKINAEVHFNHINNSEYSEKMAAKLSANEKGMDLVYSSGSNLPFATEASQLAFADITEAVYNGLGDNIVANIPAEVLAATTINGILYGVPTIKEWGDVYAIRANGLVMKHLGLFDEFNAVKWNSLNDENINAVIYKVRDALKADTTYFKDVNNIHNYESAWCWNTIEDQADAIMENGGLSYFFADGAANATVFGAWSDGELGGGNRLGQIVNWVAYDSIGAQGIGFLLNSDKAEATNVFASEGYLAGAKRVAQWEADRIAQNTSKTGGFYFLQHSYLSPLGVSQGQVYAGATYSALTYLPAESQYGEWAMAVGNPVVTKSGVLGSVYAVAANSEHVYRSVMYLDLITVNAEINNLFNYGIKDKSYTLDANNQVAFTEYGNQKETWAASAYNAQYSGNLFIRNTIAGNPTDFWTRLSNTNKVLSPYMTFEFDATQVAGEITAINTAKEIYHNNLFGCTVPEGKTVEAYVDEFNATIKANADTLIAAINAQYKNK